MKDKLKLTIEGSGISELETATAEIDKWAEGQPEGCHLKLGIGLKASANATTVLEHLHRLFEVEQLSETEFKLDIQATGSIEARKAEEAKAQQGDLFNQDGGENLN